MEVCAICKKPRADHQDMVHKFSETGVLAKAKNESRDSSSKQAPVSQIAPHIALRSDPVLRSVMIEKGLITVDELTAAEDKLRATGVIDVRSPRTPGTDREDREPGGSERGSGDPDQQSAGDQALSAEELLDESSIQLRR